MNRQSKANLVTLAACQGLWMTTVSIGTTVSGLAAQSAFGMQDLITLPHALMIVAMTLTTYPASVLMARLGRRGGLMAGAACGALGGLLTTLAILDGAFGLFCAAVALLGVFNGFAVNYRFAAADMVEPKARGEAISLVLLGGLLAGLAGPSLATSTVELFAPVLFVGCYAAIAALAGVSLLLLATLPSDARRSAAPQRRHAAPLGAFLRSRDFMAPLLCAITAYGGMTFVMVATTPAMIGCGFTLGISASVIQWHLLAMYAPSFVSGRLLRHFGALPLVAAGFVFMLLAAAAGLLGTAYANFWLTLVLVGLGWNLLFVSGTQLLAAVADDALRARVQGLNDFIVFGVTAAMTLLAGVLVQTWGWTAVATVLALLASAAGYAVWSLLADGRAKLPAASVA